MYTYAVAAYDAAGNISARSTSVTAATATPDTQPPTVSITSPTPNQTVSGAATITVTAADNVVLPPYSFSSTARTWEQQLPPPRSP